MDETAPLWGPIQRAYPLIWHAAHVLGNAAGHPAAQVQADFTRVRRTIGLVKRHCGPLEDALTHFLKVTRSYQVGLFHCYRDGRIPHTNNDLEQCFGRHRFHERRTTGRKRGTPHTVLRGPVRLLTGIASRMHPFSATELAPRDLAEWQATRQAIRKRFALRAQGVRFRRDPDAYLRSLEEEFLTSGLPV